MGPNMHLRINTDFTVTFTHGARTVTSVETLAGTAAHAIKFRAYSAGGLSLWVNNIRVDAAGAIPDLPTPATAATLGSTSAGTDHYDAAYGGVKISSKSLDNSVIEAW